MTQLEKEKRRVGDFMGWEYEDGAFSPKGQLHIILIRLDDYNPQSERKWWDEIWDRMDEKMFMKYLDNIESLFELPLFYTKDFHTAKPEVCWKALIKTLEGK